MKTATSPFTFAMIKPDALEQGFLGDIIARIQRARFSIEEMRQITLSQTLLENFYAEHRQRPFFDGMVRRMSMRPAVAMVLSSEEATVQNFRQLLGATNPAEAMPGTLRWDYGEDLDANAVHGSDSDAAVQREIALFFPERLFG